MTEYSQSVRHATQDTPNALLISKQHPSPSPRLHEIDGLRALAVTLVMIHHFATSSIVRIAENRGFTHLASLMSLTTNSGVELFFVLSGVVLLRPFLRGVRPFRALQYFRRRLERLWPPYAVALVVASGIVLLATLHPTWYSRQILPEFSWRDALRQVGILNFGWPIYNLAWWSLTPELTFYALAPIVVASLTPRALKREGLLALIGASIVLSMALWNERTSMTGVQSGIEAVGLQFLAYLPCFLVGAMIAKVDLSLRMAVALLLSGVVYVLVALYVPRANVHAGYALIYGGVVGLAMRKDSKLHHLLTHRIAIWLGERSYSLFVIHFSILYFSDYIASLVLPGRGALYALGTRVGGATVSLVAAMAIFWIVERRFARGLTTSRAFWPWQAACASLPLPTTATMVRPAEVTTA